MLAMTQCICLRYLASYYETHAKWKEVVIVSLPERHVISCNEYEKTFQEKLIRRLIFFQISLINNQKFGNRLKQALIGYKCLILTSRKKISHMMQNWNKSVAIKRKINYDHGKRMGVRVSTYKFWGYTHI